MKIGFIKDGNSKRKKKLEVVWVHEKRSDKPSLKEVEPTVKKKVVYKNTFDMRIFSKLVNYHNVTMENALRLSVDKEFCDNYYYNMGKTELNLDKCYIDGRKNYLTARLETAYFLLGQKEKELSEINVKLLDDSIIDCILENRPIARETNWNKKAYDIVKNEILELENEIESYCKEANELGFDVEVKFEEEESLDEYEDDDY